MGNAPDSSALVAGLRSLRDRWWVIALFLVVALAASLALSATATKKYAATSSLLVRPSQLPTLINPNAQITVDPQRDASTALKLVTSTAVAQRVQLALKTDRTTSDLLGEVSAKADPDADIITISATDTDPRFAARLANAFANQFVAYRTVADRAGIDDGAALLQRRLDSIPASAVDERSQVRDQLLNVRTLATVTTGDAEVVDTASIPGSSSEPRTVRNALLALALGLVLGIAAALLADLFDRRIKSVEDFEAIYRLPTLASIPERPNDPGSDRDRAAALEPFRILRNALPFVAPGHEIRVVLVTSAIPGEGKSTVAAGLARAAAQAGERVVLVECDLRRPTLRDQFDLRGDARGLTNALIAGDSAVDMLRPALAHLPTLSILPSGPTPPNAAELLRSGEMTRVLTDLRVEADLVVLDAPPLLPVADAQVLLNTIVDAVVVTARAYHTTRDEARRTRSVLDHHPHARCGLVVNGLRRLDSGYEYYGADESGRRRAARA